MDQTVEDPVMQLPGVLDLGAALPLRSELLRHRGAPLILDGSGVQRLGGLCLQIVLSAKAAWAAEQIEFELHNPSQALVEALATFGATEAMSDCQKETST